jgi:hypothetical protein
MKLLSLLERWRNTGKRPQGRTLRVKWPTIDPRKTFCEIEKEYGISLDAERDDVRDWDLGHQPSKSYYDNSEPDFEATKRAFNRIAKRYGA